MCNFEKIICIYNFFSYYVPIKCSEKLQVLLNFSKN